MKARIITFPLLAAFFIMLSFIVVSCEPEVDKTYTTVKWLSISADGRADIETTRSLELEFDMDPTILNISHITVIGATKGQLTGTGTKRSLSISNITVAQGENVTVTIATIDGWIFGPSVRNVAINKLTATEVEWLSVVANGMPDTVTTTYLTLTFDKSPHTLAQSDFIVQGAARGTFVVGVGAGNIIILTIDNITVKQGENVTVTIRNPVGFTIKPSTRSVAVNVVSN